jgi:hypothetical protein
VRVAVHVPVGFGVGEALVAVEQERALGVFAAGVPLERVRRRVVAVGLLEEEPTACTVKTVDAIEHAFP